MHLIDVHVGTLSAGKKKAFSPSLFEITSQLSPVAGVGGIVGHLRKEEREQDEAGCLLLFS